MLGHIMQHTGLGLPGCRPYTAALKCCSCTGRRCHPTPSKLGLGCSSVQDGLQLHREAHATLNLELAQQEGLRA